MRDQSKPQETSIDVLPSGSSSSNSASNASLLKIVDWNGPDDPEKPINWPRSKKNKILGAVCLMRFTTPLASSMMAPALLQIEAEFEGTSSMVMNFALSIYIIGFGIGPLILAPLSEIYGRNKIYHGGNVLFTICTACCGVAPNATSFLIFRFLSGLMGGGPLTNGGGTVADLIPVHERGFIMSVFSLSMLLAPILGPVGGGFLSEAVDWRWIFWLLTIMSGITAIVGFVFLRETYGPTLLEQKAAELRKQSGDPNIQSASKSPLPLQKLLVLAIMRPLRLLCTSPVSIAMALYMGLIFGIIYLLFTSYTVVFQERYGFSQGLAGLTYLGMGLGCTTQLFLGHCSDKIHTKLTERHGVERPEYHLLMLIPAAISLPIGLVIYGWTAQYHVHWIVPLIGTFFIGVGFSSSMTSVQTYLIGAFTAYSASALAANNVVRSLIGGVVPLSGPEMYGKLGLGWGNTMLALLALVFGLAPLWFYRSKAPRNRTKTSPV
ncbi:MFS general substrate transporter [Penicillium paradoxum]|uniref:MFS general substrate transporter n=1 Tax=Penicillium paradoxum TaxID=176176 RepID=UPI00254891C8|nr:MFS general substrate transporter [Penicillium paradoxum]KAJ5788790.1 MFS general substrate transporter [Penicillium paradoxum]